MLTNYNGTSITYDAAGNPLNWRNANVIEWLENAGKQMSLIYQAGKGVYMYEYNFDGIRTKKTLYQDDAFTLIYESEYILNGTTIIQEKRTYGDGSVVILDFLYDDSGSILGVIYNGTAYYYRKNLQGDITGIVNSAGTLVVSYTYDAWGKPVSITGSMASTLGEINPIRYRGYYYDTETGFYYLQSRYYDPVVGRFISADSTDFLGITGTTLSLNLFAYCENNAVNMIDPSGNVALVDDAAILTAAALVIVATAFILYISSPSFQKSWRSFCSAVSDFFSSAWKKIRSLFVNKSKEISNSISKTIAKSKEKINSEKHRYSYWIAAKITYENGRSLYIPTTGISYSFLA